MTKRTRATRAAIFDVIKAAPWVTVDDIHKETGISKGTVRGHVNAMMEGKVIQRKTKGIGQHGWAPAYARAGLTEVPKWCLYLDDQHFYPESVQLGLKLESDTHPPGAVEYSWEYRDLPIVDWRLSIITKQRLEILHDEDNHALYYFDPELRAWISGEVILIRADVQGAELEGDRADVTYLYSLNGLGNPNRPEIEWASQHD